MTAPQTTVRCLPTYLLIDISSSMRPVQDVLNDAVVSFCTELVTATTISDLAHVSIIVFSTDATIALPITDIQRLTQLPELECGGVTNLSSAFRLVRQCIDRDIDLLNGNGLRVLRPVVFVLTDGLPTDAEGWPDEMWRGDYKQLVDKGWRRRPNVVSFGLGNATIEVIREMSTNPEAAFIVTEAGPADALRKIFAMLLHTLVASARTRVRR